MKKGKGSLSANETALDKSLKLIVKTSFIVLVGLILSKVLGYTYRIIIARYFGPEEYGIFSLANVILGFFIALFGLGLSEGIIRFTALYRGEGKKDKIKYLFRWSSKLLAISGIIGAIVLFLTSNYLSINLFHNAGLIYYLRVFSILTLISLLVQPFLSLLRGYEKIAVYSFYFNIFQNVIKVISLILMVWIGFKSKSIALSNLIAISFMLVGLYLASRVNIGEVFTKFNLTPESKKEIRAQVSGYSLPLMFFSILSLIFYWVDTFSLGYLKSAVEVGVYNAAVPIAMLLFVIPEIFMQLFFPLISKEYGRNNRQLITQLSKQVTKWISIASFPIFILLFLFPGAALNLLFGSQFLGAEMALRILLLSAILTTTFTVSQQLLSMAGKSKTILISMIIATIINLLLNQILIPIKTLWFIDNATGINGAAAATLISNLIFLTLIFIQSYKYTLILPFRKKIINVFFSSILALIPLLVLRNLMQINLYSIALMCMTFVLVYVLLLFLTKSLDIHDIEILKKIKSKITSNRFN